MTFTHRRLIAALAFAALPVFPAAAQDPDMVWEYHRYVAENPLDTYLGLNYGIPQTDAVAAQVACHIGANWIYVGLLLAYDVSALTSGTEVEVEYTAPGYAQFHDATVIQQEEGTWGIEVVFDLTDPVWNVLASQTVLNYQVPGGAVSQVPLSGAAGLITRFIADCAQIADLTPDSAPGK